MTQDGATQTNGVAHVTRAPFENGRRPVGMNSLPSLLEQACGWAIANQGGVLSLIKSFDFQDFTLGLDFALHTGLMATLEGHLPVLVVQPGRVTVSWSTGLIGELKTQDLICAIKTDAIYGGQYSDKNPPD